MRRRARVPAMQKGQLKWDDLRVFLEVARASRLMAAGRELGVDPATVGRRIGALEAAPGGRPFDRAPQGYPITAAGRAPLAHARASAGPGGAPPPPGGGPARPA